MKKTTLHLALMLFMAPLFFCFLFESCIHGITCENGNGAVIKEERNVSNFTEIEVSGAYNIILKQDSITSLIVETDSNLVDLVITRNEGSKLIIENDESLCPSKETNIYISTPDIDAINISGASDIKSAGHIYTDGMNIVMSGASEIGLDLTTKNLMVECSGAAKLDIKGEAENVTAEISGAADINAYELITKTFALTESGSGSANINVADKLEVEISGAANVNYKGNPSVTEKISGVGQLQKVD
jgi:hypothetical protein